MQNIYRLRGVPFRMARLCLLTSMAITLLFTVGQSNASTPKALTYGAWNVECKPRSGETENICVASQSVTAEKNKNQVIIGVLVAYMPEHPLPHIIFRISPKANINKGAAVKVDEQAFLNVPISSCDKNICEVRSFIPEELLQQMREGNLLKFAFFVGDKQLIYPVSLKEFDKAYTALLTDQK